MATSVGGVLTGRGADIIIIDDPLKPDEALSESQRKAANDWYDHTLYSRLNDKRTGCNICHKRSFPAAISHRHDPEVEIVERTRNFLEMWCREGDFIESVSRLEW